ncbi:hypothetical protein LUD75_14280 [Epilithonimonas sp. JDS]|uniref:hypothetical protein n=1 Tax=Epilithonimonas sp. JDS TaxID=2902797 RepID=UPI001E4C2539|nr:hypothetical protein [Epilithonimonas sp. JDS]MCD9855889.1 hypothetical protein [Epilithonimonas sp. JDS]
MRKITIISFLTLQNLLYSQEKINLSHVIKSSDFIEVSLELDNKPNDKFHLIKIETITANSNQSEIMKNNQQADNIYRRANVLTRFEIPSKDVKSITLKGTLKYFRPTEKNKSYLKIGKVGAIKKNINLISSNDMTYFGIVDNSLVEKTFPDLKLRSGSNGELKPVDYKTYDLMYAYRNSRTQDITPIVNDELEFGFNTLTLNDKKTGTIYKLVKLKREMSQSEKDAVNIDLLIENENAVTKIPFEFKNVKIREL